MHSAVGSDSLAAAWSADPVVVRAEGMAAVIEGNTARAREEATRQLYRDAVEKAVGAYVQGITEMKDFAVVRDRVFSQSQGIVTSTKNLVGNSRTGRHSPPDCGLFCFHARSRRSSRPAVIDMLGNPRVMVLVDEVVEGERQFLSTAEERC